MEYHVPGHVSMTCVRVGCCWEDLPAYVWNLVAVWSSNEVLEDCSYDRDLTTSQFHPSMFSVSRQERVHMWH